VNIFCVGQNYAKHAKELGNEVPKEPVFFQKTSSCLSSDTVIRLPERKVIHYEVELVMVLGRAGNNISPQSTMNHISHWCLGLDLTDRPRQTEMRERGLPWFDSKTFPGAAVITDVESFNQKEIAKDFWLKKNGEEVQRGNVKDMVFDIATLISGLSEIVTFGEGDLLFTGTPSGVGPLKTSDELELGSGNNVKGRFSVT